MLTMNKTFQQNYKKIIIKKRGHNKRVMSNTDGKPPLCTGASQAQQQAPNTTTHRQGAMTHFATTHIKCVCSGYLA